MDPKTLPASAPVAAPSAVVPVADPTAIATPAVVEAAPAADSGKDSAVADAAKDTAAADTGSVVDADAVSLFPLQGETSIIGLLVLVLSGVNIFLRKAQKALRVGVEQAQAEAARISALLVRAEGRIADLEGLTSRVEDAEKVLKVLKAAKK